MGSKTRVGYWTAGVIVIAMVLPSLPWERLVFRTKVYHSLIQRRFSGMARAIIHNSDYGSAEECMRAIEDYFAERNQYYHDNPRRAGPKIWGKELVEPEFRSSNNCKDPNWRQARVGLPCC